MITVLLKKAAYKSKQTRSSRFSFSLERIGYLHEKTLLFLHNFSIYINDNIFTVNSAFASLLSDNIFDMISLNPSSPEIHFMISESSLSIFSLIFSLLEGNTLCIQKSEVSSFIEVMNAIRFSFGIKFLSAQISVPSTIEESLNFLQYHPIHLFQKHFSQSLFIISSNFTNIQFQLLSSLSPDILHQILSSPTLRVRTEEDLCSIIEQLISINEMNKILLSDIDFRYLGKETVRRVLSHTEVEDIEETLLCSLKERLFCSVIVDAPEERKGRYLEPPSTLNEGEVLGLIQEVETFFKSRKNLVSKLHSHFVEFKKMKSENLPKKEDVPFSSIHKKGILSSLSGKVTITASSVYRSYSANNVLDWTDSYWQSQNQPNNWICFQFSNQKISLTGYRIRFCSRSYVLRIWKIEGSNDNSAWTLIDEKTDSSIPNPEFEAAFQCSPSSPCTLR